MSLPDLLTRPRPVEAPSAPQEAPEEADPYDLTPEEEDGIWRAVRRLGRMDGDDVSQAVAS